MLSLSLDCSVELSHITDFVQLCRGHNLIVLSYVRLHKTAVLL